MACRIISIESILEAGSFGASEQAGKMTLACGRVGQAVGDTTCIAAFLHNAVMAWRCRQGLSAVGMRPLQRPRT